MRLLELHKIITNITDDSVQNHMNYMSSLRYVKNLYEFLNTLGSVADMANIEIVSKYKDLLISDSLGMITTEEENEFRYFVIKSPMFSNDKLVNKIKVAFNEKIEDFKIKDNTITIILSKD